ncbi:MAG TPA: hypothetical protein V6D28_16470 [Leptolyngbyaceae cyanobacterium]
MTEQNPDNLPKSTDAVLGGQFSQPKLYDAVLGGQILQPKIEEEVKNNSNPTEKRVFNAKELTLFGCDKCKSWRSPTNHDWTLHCSQCGKFFEYGGCSCDGCCGEGTYAGFGGGEEFYTI